MQAVEDPDGEIARERRPEGCDRPCSQGQGACQWDNPLLRREGNCRCAGRRWAPVLVDAVVSRMVPVKMAKGFTLYIAKAVMSGRGRDLIDLAKANLWD